MAKTTALIAGLGVGLMVLALSGAPRRASADAPPGRYAVASGEVQDTQTGLVWQQARSGSTMQWSAAQSYCTGLGLNGHRWRLPSINELQTLVDEGTMNPAIDATAFPGTSAEYYWSSSALAGSSSYAWFVAFYYGFPSYDGVAGANWVRCVR